MNTRLEKYEVCNGCFLINRTGQDCICFDNENHRTIELEFQVCECCGNIIDDGEPADTDFNKKQLNS